MPNHEGPPPGTDYWDSFYRVVRVDSGEELLTDALETKPLEHVSLYLSLITKLDLVRLKLKNLDHESRIAWDIFDLGDFDFLNTELKELLGFENEALNSIPVKLSVYHERGQSSWISIDNGGRALVIEFESSERKVSSKFRPNASEEFREGSVTKGLRHDVNRILDLVYRSGSV